jgi:glucose/arabinose dehydrogenase
MPTGLELVADGFDFPTSVTFDEEGAAYVAEAGLPFDGAAPGGRVWRLGPDGDRSLVADGLRAPVNGVTWHGDALYLSEGGHPARLSRVHPDGTRGSLLEGLPGPGNYHLNMAVVGPDAKLYFSQGAMTNLGIVGLDAYELGWLRRLPHDHDVPGLDVTLDGVNVTTPDPTADAVDAEVVTGAFVPFGTPTEPGRRVPAGLPATASVMRCNLDGSGLELVAWGLRNAYGLGFLPDGRLLAIDQGADDRGSRPIGAAPDLLFEVRPGCWYGWPDYVGEVPVTDERFRPQRGPHPSFVLADHETLPPPERALLAFPPHVAAVKFDLAPERSALSGSLLVALFGDEAPMTAPPGPRVGRGVVAVDTTTWQLRPLLSGDPLCRPIDVRVHDGEAHVLDFGEFEMTDEGVEAKAGTGRLWRLRLPT